MSAVVLLACSCAVWAQGEPTHFRKHHVLHIQAQAGQELTLEVTCIAASIGYLDPLVYSIFGPDGKTAARGTLQPGESKTLTFRPEVDGIYLFDGNPGMNAFSVQVTGGAWAVSISESRVVNVIDHANPLYFLVPDGMKSIMLGFGGEAATVRLLRPDGSEAASRKLKNYENATVTADVAGQPGWWRLELDLAEDQGITFPAGIVPCVAEAPLPDELLQAWLSGVTVAQFDLRPTPPAQLQGRPGATADQVKTNDGLALGLAGDGRVVSVKLDGTELLAGDKPPLSGFFARDAAAESDLTVFEGSASAADGAVDADLRAEGLDLSLQARYRAEGDHIAVDVTVEDLRGEDRAVTVYFALPYPCADPIWWDDILTTRPADSNTTFGAFARCAAGNGSHSTYPFGCVGGDEGLALAIPMDHPIYHRIGACGGSRQLYLAVDLGLTEATAKFPSRAGFSFVIYRCDGRWGLRSAAERYYAIFPDLFVKRMKRDGGWVCWGTVEGMTNLDELGFLYHWGPGGASAIKYDDQIGIYSFIYNDSMRFFADVGKFDKRPSAAQAAESMQKLLDSDDPRAYILNVRPEATGRRRYEARERTMGREAAETWLREAIAAVKRSAMLNAEGRIQVGYLVNRKDWGGTDWWSGRCSCNIDPDIEGGWGRFLFDRWIGPQVEGYRAEGAEYDGIGLDNFFSNARLLDFDRAHLAACDFPPTFAAGDFRPVVVGDTIMYEWVRELKSRLEAEGKWLIANTGHQPFCFNQHLLDINGLEWGLERTAPATRTLACHKQVVSLPVKPEHYREHFIKMHLPMGAIPGGYGRGKQFAPGTETAALYAKYVPILRRMQGAGWEPVPRATTDSADVSVERFGTSLPLLFSLHNHADQPREVTVTIELAALNAQEATTATDLVEGADLKAKVVNGNLVFTTTLAASDATAVEVK
ncbi:MAG: hypothetical protein J7M38_11875 [Armatimonadetes bacterium]|nr:hypothetical protein [Armatimonadota bacterium]